MHYNLVYISTGMRGMGLLISRIACCLMLFVISCVTPALAESSGPAPSVSLSILADPDGTLTLEDVIARPGDFTPSGTAVEAMTEGGIYWLRIELEYPEPALDRHWQLDFNWNFLRNLKLYIPDHPTFTPIDSGDWNFTIDTVFNLPRPVDDTLVCYVRMESYLVFNIRLDIRPVDSAQAQHEQKIWIFGIFFGLLGGMLLYNGFLAVSLKDSTYFWYVAHLFFLCSYYVWMNGFLPSNSAYNTQQWWSVFIHWLVANQACLFASMILFARSFLSSREHTPKIYWSISALLVLPAITFFHSIFDPVGAIDFVSVVGISSALVILICSIISVFQGYKPARIFLVGWAFYLGGGMIHSMAWQGIIPSSPLTNNALQIGTAVEVLVMSLALAYRVRLLQDAKTQVEASLAATRKEKALLSLILENSQLGIGLIKDNRFIWGNMRLAKLFGVEDDRFENLDLNSGTGLSTLFSTPSSPSVHKHHEREAAIDIPPYGYRHFRTLGRFIDEQTPAEGMVWVAEDVTDHVRLEKLKEDVDSIMRHDLLSPLAAIQLILDTLLEADNLTDEQKKVCGMTADAIYQMLAQVNAYMAIYKMETGKYCADPEPVDLVTVLSHVRMELAPIQQSQGVEIVISDNYEHFVVLGQESLFHTMLVNLLRNALEASPPGSRVVVTFSGTDRKRLSIRNQGAVPESVRETFFEKYVTAGKPGGTGLGTYSARMLAESQGARIELDHSEPDVTTVTIIFRSRK